MATYYFRNVGTNWGDAANWSLTDGGGATGVVPLATDDAVFTNNSGNCTVNALNRVCQTLNFNGGTGYLNTITFTFNISVGGSITLGTSMVFAGAASLRYVGIANSTFTSNGKEVGVPFEIAADTNNHTITYADNWTFGENFTIQSGTASIMTYNGNTLNCKKALLTNNVGARNISGTTSIIMIGTGSIGAAASANVNVGLNLTINTAGSYTFNSLIWGYLGSKTLTYTAGTITVTANATLTLRIGATATNTLNLNGVDFENITIGGGGTQTYTLTSNLKCKVVTQADSSTPIIMNGNTLFLTSFSNVVSLVNGFSGSTIFYFNCWSGNGSFNAFTYSMTDTVVDISNGNTLFLGNTVGAGLLFFGLNFTHLQGDLIPILVSFTGTFVDVLPNVVFNTIANNNGFGFTLKSNITVRNLGSLNQAPNSSFAINGSGYSATVLDSFINSQYITNAGTAKLIMGGNTNININIASFGAGIASEFEINTNGVVTFNTTTQAMFRGIFRHVKGQVIAKGTNIWFRNGATILGASRCNFDNVLIDGTVTMDEFFSGVPQIPTKVNINGSGNYVVNFQDGFEKIAKNVIVSNCTVGRRGQLLLLSKGSFKSTNIGIRYYNQSPNGVGSNLGTFVDNTLPSTQPFRKIPMLVGDPAYT
jgi:hypothetical protein